MCSGFPAPCLTRPPALAPSWLTPFAYLSRSSASFGRPFWGWGRSAAPSVPPLFAPDTPLGRLSASSLWNDSGVPLRCLSCAARGSGRLRRWVLPLPLLLPPFSICICTKLPHVYAPCSAVCTFVNPCACASLGGAPLPSVAPAVK